METFGYGDGIWLDFSRTVGELDAWFARHFLLSPKFFAA